MNGILKKFIQCSTVILLATGIACTSLPASALAEEKTTPSGIAFSEIGKEIEAYAKDKTYPSFETAIFCGDEVLYTGCFGYSDVENQIPADEETVYEWGSTTKTLTWVSVMQLWEQGKLDLEADVRTYLPDDFFQHLSYDDPITMLDLMNHRAGFQDTIYTMGVQDESKITSLYDTLKAIEPAQINKPGTVTSYSNWGTTLAGYIVERVSGESYVDYVHHHIFEPLGMEHTAIDAAHTDNQWVRQQRGKLKTYYVAEENGSERLENLGDAWYVLLYPAGSATGTLGDLLKYGQSLVDENTPLFEKSATLDYMLSASSFIGDTGIPNSCHGFIATQYAVEVLGHNGSTIGCSANLCFNRETGIGTVVMTNQDLEDYFISGIPKLIFGDMCDNPILTSFEITDASDFSGYYMSNRSMPKGIFKLPNMMSFLPVQKISDTEYYIIDGVTVTQVSNDVCLLDMGGSKGLVAAESDENGRRIIRNSVDDYTEDSLIPIQLVSIAVYVVIAVISVILLLVKLIRYIMKKNIPYSGAAMITAGQLAKILSIIMIPVLIYRMSAGWGLAKTDGIIIGCVQGLCMIVCAAAAISSTIQLFSKRDTKAKNFKYILNVLVNTFAVGFAAYFDLFQFWGC